MTNILEMYNCRICFSPNENQEPIHIFISKDSLQENATKVWLTKSGGCIVANNNSKISKTDMNNIIKIITINHTYIVAKWKDIFGTDSAEFYC